MGKSVVILLWELNNQRRDVSRSKASTDVKLKANLQSWRIRLTFPRARQDRIGALVDVAMLSVCVCGPICCFWWVILANMYSIECTNPINSIPRNTFLKQSKSLKCSFQHVILCSPVNLACRSKCRLLQGSTDSFSKGPESKYSGLCKPYGLCHNYALCCFSVKAAIDYT